MSELTQPRRPVYRFALLVWGGHVLLSLWLGRAVLGDVSEQTGPLAWAYMVWVFLAWHATFMGLPLLLLAPALRWLPWLQGSLARTLFSAALWLPLALFAYADAVMYQLYGYHLDGMVLNVLMNPASQDSVQVGSGTLRALYLGAGSTAAISLALAALAAWWDQRRGPAPALGRRRILGSALAILLFLAGEKLVYAVAIQMGASTFTQARPLLGPLYYPLSARGFLKKTFGLEVAQGQQVQGGTLHYPAADLSWETPTMLPDIVLIVVESAHAGGLDPGVMPNLTAYAQQNLSSPRHYANANMTRYGIFSLMYGLVPTYWPAVEATRHEPLLMQRVRELDYDIRIISSTDLRFPEFRQTVFNRTDPSRIYDHWPEAVNPVQRDARGTELLIEHLRSASTEPLFAWMFLDGSHFPYVSEAAQAPFQPTASLEDMNLLDIQKTLGEELRVPLRNRSLNALHTIDARLPAVFAALEERAQHSGRPQAVVMVGDHGEGFGEYGGRGHFIHNGAFSLAQTTTIFAAKIPGLAPQVLPGPTSHLDIASTLLRLLGARGPREAFAQGRIWGEERPAPWILCSNWNEAALMFDAYTLRFGIGTHTVGILELYDEQYRVVPVNGNPDIPWQSFLGEAAFERGRFLRRR